MEEFLAQQLYGQLDDLQAHLAALQQENNILRSHLQSCEQSCAILQAEVAQSRRQTQSWQEQIAVAKRNEVIAREQEQAAQERAAELAKANEAMCRVLTLTARETGIDSLLGNVLQAIAEQFVAPIVEWWEVLDDVTVAKRLSYWNGQLLTVEDMVGHHGVPQFQVDLSLQHSQPSTQWKIHIVIEDVEWLPYQPAEIEKIRAWYVQNGTRKALNIPVLVGDRTIGGVIVFVPETCGFSESQIEFGYAMARHVALAVLISRRAEEAKQAAIAREQEKAAQERAAELAKANESLRRSVERMVSDSRLEILISVFLIEAIETVGAAAAAVMLRIPDSLRFTPAAVVEDGRLLSSEELANDPYLSRYVEFSSTDIGGIFSNLARGETPSIRVDDLREIFPEAYTYHQQRGHCIIWHTPLRLQGEVIGFTGIALRENRLPSHAVRETVTALAQQLTLALELTRLADEAKQAAIAHEQEQAAQQRTAELAKANEALRRSLDSLASEPSLDKFLGQVLTAIAEQFDSTLTEYWYHTGDTAYIGMLYLRGQLYDRQSIAQSYPWHLGLAGFVVPQEMLGGQPLSHRRTYFINEDLLTHPSTAPFLGEAWHKPLGLLAKRSTCRCCWEITRLVR